MMTIEKNQYNQQVNDNNNALKKGEKFMSHRIPTRELKKREVAQKTVTSLMQQKQKLANLNEQSSTNFGAFSQTKADEDYS